MLGSRVQSFRHAASGLVAVVASQANARIQLAIALGVLALGATLGLPAADWCWLVAAIALVLAAECSNTALEWLADAVHPDPHPLVGRAKDAAAGAVLCTSLGAGVIGLLVLGRPLLAWWASR